MARGAPDGAECDENKTEQCHCSMQSTAADDDHHHILKGRVLQNNFPQDQLVIIHTYMMGKEG